VPAEPLVLRDATPPALIVVVRLGSGTLFDVELGRRCQATFWRWGIHGFSVLEVPARTDWELLARLRPEVTTRRLLFIADGSDLVSQGFPLLPTLSYPHWSVVLSEPSSDQFTRIRALFRGPEKNPVWTSASGGLR
jgi:hypothetical protein